MKKTAARREYGMPAEFELERYMAKYEFQVAHPLCLSDCEPLTLAQVLALADEECKQLWSQLSLGYTESDGHPLLRQEIAKLYLTLPPEHILVLIPQEAIQIACRAMLRPGDHVVCMQPAYQSLYENALSIGCDVSFWEMQTERSGRLHFAVEDFKKLVTPDTRAVFVNFPHNPSGALVSLSDWKEVISCCRNAGAYLFSDEMYRTLEADPASRLPAAADCYEKAVSLCGMSKSLGMPGIRLGWLASNDPLLFSRLQLLHDYYSICHAAPSEILAIIGLRARNTIVAENQALIAENIKLAQDFFSRHSDVFEFHPPQGSSIAFPRLVIGEPIQEFCERLLSETGIYLLPATVYGYQKSVSEGRFRLGLGRKNLAKGLHELEKFLVKETERHPR